MENNIEKIKEFYEICKEYDSEKINNFLIKNKFNLCRFLENYNDWKYDYTTINLFKNHYKFSKIFVDILKDFYDNQKFNLIDFLCKKCYLNVFLILIDSDVKFAEIFYERYIKNNTDYVTIHNIHKEICNIINSFDLERFKKITCIIKNYNISMIEDSAMLNCDEILIYLCNSFCKDYNYKYTKPEYVDINIRKEFIKYVLKIYDSNYNLSTIKTIKDGIENSYFNYEIIKYLNEYIEEREKENLQKMIYEILNAKNKELINTEK